MNIERYMKEMTGKAFSFYMANGMCIRGKLYRIQFDGYTPQKILLEDCEITLVSGMVKHERDVNFHSMPVKPGSEHLS